MLHESSRANHIESQMLLAGLSRTIYVQFGSFTGYALVYTSDILDDHLCKHRWSDGFAGLIHLCANRQHVE